MARGFLLAWGFHFMDRIVGRWASTDFGAFGVFGGECSNFAELLFLGRAGSAIARCGCCLGTTLFGQTRVFPLNKYRFVFLIKPNKF